MNLFYLLGTNNYLVDSNLDITSSFVHSSKTDGVSLYPYILTFEDGGADGVYYTVIDLSSFITDTDLHDANFTYYSDFVLVDNICNFIGSRTSGSVLRNKLTSLFVDGSLAPNYLVLSDIVWTGITYGNGVYCIVGKSDDNEITIGTSGDKVTWTYNTITTVDPVSSPKVSFGNNVFILVDKAIYYSTSGDSWSSVYDDTNTWNDIEYSNKGFIAYNGSNSCTSIDGITWSLHTLPSIIGTDATLASWKNIVSNGDILCMKSSPDIIDSTTDMSSITFSDDGGLSWMTQTLLDGADQGIVSLSAPKFWEHFVQSTEL